MQQHTFFALEQIIDRHPLTVTPDTSLVEAIALMQQRGNNCKVDSSENSSGNSSCVLIAENHRLRGVFTERDLVKLIATETDLVGVAMPTASFAIALIITDIMMPGMDGKTVIRTLKQIDPEVRVIAVSGLITNQEILKELDGEVMAFLSKPYSNEELVETVYEIVSS